MLKYIYFSLPLFLSFHTFETMDKSEIKALTLAVYDIVKMIPYGRATSYGAIAKAIGYPNMSRLVGRIMSECNSQIMGLPAHRVVNSQGILSADRARIRIVDWSRSLLTQMEHVIIRNAIACSLAINVGHILSLILK